MKQLQFAVTVAWSLPIVSAPGLEPIPDKLVVLTFDDSVKSLSENLISRRALAWIPTAPVGPNVFRGKPSIFQVVFEKVV
jgi:hypothetical protein